MLIKWTSAKVEVSRKITTVYVLAHENLPLQIIILPSNVKSSPHVAAAMRLYSLFLFFSGRNLYKIILLKISVLKAEIRCRLAGSVLS